MTLDLWPALLTIALIVLRESSETVVAIAILARIHGWRRVLAGTIAGVAALVPAAVFAVPVVRLVPHDWLALAVGVLFLIFGLTWLCEAIRVGGGLAEARDPFARLRDRDLDRHLVAAVTLLVVLREGLEIMIAVVAFNVTPGAIGLVLAAAIAMYAVVMLLAVFALGFLERLPRNWLRLAIAVMASAFGILWTGEGLGLEWPGGSLMLVPIVTALAAWTAAAIFSLRGGFHGQLHRQPTHGGD